MNNQKEAEEQLRDWGRLDERGGVVLVAEYSSEASAIGAAKRFEYGWGNVTAVKWDEATVAFHTSSERTEANLKENLEAAGVEIEAEHRA